MAKQGPVVASEVPPRAKASNYPEPFASRVAGRQKQVLGDVFGLKNFGVNRTTLKPGAMSALRHWHGVQDEFVYILSGHPDARDRCRRNGAPSRHVHGVQGRRSGRASSGEPDEGGRRVPGGRRPPAGRFGRSTRTTICRVAKGPDGNWQFRHKDGTPY